MKAVPAIIFCICVVSFILVTGSCKKGDDPKPDAQEVQVSNLSKTWKVTEVRLNNTSLTGYSELKLVLSGSFGNALYGYNVTGAPDNNPWPASGSWKFGNPMESKIIRDPGNTKEVEVTYALTNDELRLNFIFNGKGFPGNRTASIEGAWSFTLVPE